MRVRSFVLLLALALAALGGAAAVAAQRAPTRELIRQMQQMAALSDDALLDMALLEAATQSRAATQGRRVNFVLDESEPRVLVEAAAEAEAEAQEGEAQSHPAASPPSSAAELLAPRVAGPSAPNTFHDAPPRPVRREPPAVTQPRLARAKYHLAKRAHQEHVKEYEAYQRKLARYNWARAVEQSRQSHKFERKLHAQHNPPAASSHAASMNGDRVHNTLFPAATPKSDGKASSTQSAFQHRGHGDGLAAPPHTTLVEAGVRLTRPIIDASLLESENPASTPAAAPAAAPAKKVVSKKASAKPAAAAAAPAAPAAAKPAAAKGPLPAGPAPASERMPAEELARIEPQSAPILDAPPAPASAAAEQPQQQPPQTEDPASMPLQDAGVDQLAAHDGAPAPVEDPSNPADTPEAPLTAAEPCALACDVAGGWRTAACQDCLMRGMVNGWIVRAIADAQTGYNYAWWARNQCAAHVQQLQLRGEEGKGAPFAHCFFQKMHETCNL